MANGIPPLLPASPPPMCELDYYDEDDDDFGDFSNATENRYQDNITVNKSITDNKLTNTSQVFDPGAKHEVNVTKSTDETSIINNDSFGELIHQHIPTSIQDYKTEIAITKEVSDVNVGEIDIPNHNGIGNTNEQNHSVENNDTSNSHIFNDDDSSFEDSVSENCDKNEPINRDNNDLNFDERLKNHIVDDNDSISSKHELPSDSEESNIHPRDNPVAEDEFSSFHEITETVTEDVTSLNGNIEQIEPPLLRASSEDSDDSNIPIDINCFITDPQELEKQDDFGDFVTEPSKDDFTDFVNESSVDDFGDFVQPVLDFATSNSSSSANFHVDCSDSKPSPIVTTDLPQDAVDDDFSDFVSTTSTSSKQTVEISNTEQTSLFDQIDSLQEDVSVTRTSYETDFTKASTSYNLDKIYDLSSECWNEIFEVCGEEQIEVNLNTFEGKLNGSSVWCKIKDIETSPALSYNWNNSETQKILLSALYVDSRNILFGPRWNSEVPRFASNLGFSPLVPEKATERKDPQPVSISPQTVQQQDPTPIENAPKVPASVPEAHFDWNNSGLTNPLDNHTHSSLLDLDLLASFDIHSPYYKNNRKGERTRGSGGTSSSYDNSLFSTKTHREEPSEEAKEILNNLPNLYVMEKQYIVFPVS